MSDVDDLAALIAPIVESAGYAVYDVQRNGGTLSVLVQGPEGIDIDDLSSLSRQVSVLLDEHDPIPGRYTLELSSPGVERRLRRLDHFQGAVGEQVNIRTVPGEQGRRRVVGQLLSVENGCIVVDDSETGEVSVSLDEIDKARTVFEWGPTPRPGRGPQTKAGSSGRQAGGRGR